MRYNAHAVMPNCAKCHTPYPAGTEFCTRDGQPLDDGMPTRVASRPEIVSVADADVEAEAEIEEVPSDPATQFATDDRLGTVLGNYRVLDLLGRGGMGMVYLAEHVALGRRVALKVLRGKFGTRPEIVQRFFHEARAVNQIRHPNIVDVTDFVHDGQSTYFVMELLSGYDLNQLLRDHGPLPVHRVLAIAVQVCDALGAAHRVGIVHRDMKPDNVFLIDWRGQKDFVKVLDFGVAKLAAGVTRTIHLDGEVDDSNPNLTILGQVMGTPAYMSPEQAAGTEVDGRSDVYSVGAILYKAFTNRPPFRAPSLQEYIKAHLTLQPLPPRAQPWGPPVPQPLEDVILKCLAKSPSDRYQSMAELEGALRRILDAARPASELGRDRAGASRRWVLAVGLGAGLGAAALAGILIAQTPLGGAEEATGRPAAPIAAPAPPSPGNPDDGSAAPGTAAVAGGPTATGAATAAPGAAPTAAPATAVSGAKTARPKGTKRTASAAKSDTPTATAGPGGKKAVGSEIVLDPFKKKK